MFAVPVSVDVACCLDAIAEIINFRLVTDQCFDPYRPERRATSLEELSRARDDFVNKSAHGRI